jgi:hypothetical protein
MSDVGSNKMLPKLLDFDKDITMSKKETLCKWDKDTIKENWDQLIKLVREPEYVCKRCGRAVNDKDRVCKGEKIR